MENKKRKIKLSPENIQLDRIESYSLEGFYGKEEEEWKDDANDQVVVFPILKTKRNKENYDGLLFYLVTHIGCLPWEFDDIEIHYRLYTMSKHLELALSYAGGRNDWGECIEVNIDDLDDDELYFIINWFIGEVDDKIRNCAMITYGLREDDNLCSKFDVSNMSKYEKWYEQGNKCFKFMINNIFDLNLPIEIGIANFTPNSNVSFV